MPHATRPPGRERLRVPGIGASPKDPTFQQLLEKQRLQVPKGRIERVAECTSADLDHPATAWNLYEWRTVTLLTTIAGT